MKLSSFAKELETKVGTRVAQERNQGIGVAGHLNYTVDRGPFSFAIENDALLVRTELRAHAEACRGASCYASCEPQGRATATVPLRLTPDYRFAPSKVTFAFTRGCEVKLAGGILRVDVTPTIQAQLGPALRRVEQEIDAKLPSMKPQAERLWTELGKTRALPLGGCVITNPRGIVQGPATGTPDALRVRFGLVAYPEIRTASAKGCESGPATNARVEPPRPLPPLAQDPRLPPEDDLVVGLVASLATTIAGLESSTTFDTGSQVRTRVAHINAAAALDKNTAQIDLGLRGDLCGDVGIRTPITWSEDGKALRLSAATYALPSESERTSPHTDPALFLHIFSMNARVPPPMDPDALSTALPSVASSMSDPSMSVAVKVTSVKPLDVALRSEDVVAAVVMRGSVELKER